MHRIKLRTDTGCSRLSCRKSKLATNLLPLVLWLSTWYVRSFGFDSLLNSEKEFSSPASRAASSTLAVTRAMVSFETHAKYDARPPLP